LKVTNQELEKAKHVAAQKSTGQGAAACSQSLLQDVFLTPTK
jgi:hypothetical protein